MEKEVDLKLASQVFFVLIKMKLNWILDSQGAAESAVDWSSRSEGDARDPQVITSRSGKDDQMMTLYLYQKAWLQGKTEN